MDILSIVILALLILGFVLSFTRAGRLLFDVAVLICLVVLLAGVLK